MTKVILINVETETVLGAWPYDTEEGRRIVERTISQIEEEDGKKHARVIIHHRDIHVVQSDMTASSKLPPAAQNNSSKR